jgi:DHA2 family multidrug resistance protein
MEGFIETGARRLLEALAAICCLVVVGFNYGVTTVAYNDIQGNFGVSLNEVTRMGTAFKVGVIVMIPLCNWLSSLIGRRDFLAWAAIFLGVCSFFCGNTTSLNWLIIFRFMQGLSVGAMLVMSHTILTESWPVGERVVIQLAVVAAVVIGGGLSLPVAGYVVDNYGWPFIFFLNIPLGIIAGVLVFVFVRNGAYDKQEDWLGNLMLILGAGSLYVGFERWQYEGELSFPLVIVLGLVGVMGMAIFIWRQFRLLNVQLRAGLILITINSFFSGSQMVFRNHSLTIVKENSILPVILIAVAAAVITTILILWNKKSSRYLIAIGLLVNMVCWCLSLEDLSGELNYVVRELRSAGAGILLVAIITLALSELEKKEIGRGVAYYHVMEIVGGILATPVFLGLPYFWELFK